MKKVIGILLINTAMALTLMLTPIAVSASEWVSPPRSEAGWVLVSQQDTTDSSQLPVGVIIAHAVTVLGAILLLIWSKVKIGSCAWAALIAVGIPVLTMAVIATLVGYDSTSLLFPRLLGATTLGTFAGITILASPEITLIVRRNGSLDDKSRYGWKKGAPFVVGMKHYTAIEDIREITWKVSTKAVDRGVPTSDEVSQGRFSIPGEYLEDGAYIYVDYTVNNS